MATLQPQDLFRQNVLAAYFTGAFKVALSNTAIGSDDDYADVAEIANGNGYTTGGISVTPTVSGNTTSAKVAFADVTLTATGALPAWRYGLLYRVSDGKGVQRYDAGTTQSMGNGDSRVLDFSAFAFQIGTP